MGYFHPFQKLTLLENFRWESSLWLEPAHHAHQLIPPKDAFSSHHSTVIWLADLRSFAVCTVSHLFWRPDVFISVLSPGRVSLLPACAGKPLHVLRTPSHQGSACGQHSCCHAVRVL